MVGAPAFPLFAFGRLPYIHALQRILLLVNRVWECEDYHKGFLNSPSLNTDKDMSSFSC